jgi:hypothetical protein
MVQEGKTDDIFQICWSGQFSVSLVHICTSTGLLIILDTGINMQDLEGNVI